MKAFKIGYGIQYENGYYYNIYGGGSAAIGRQVWIGSKRDARELYNHLRRRFKVKLVVQFALNTSGLPMYQVESN